jgi:hypothetical protein
MLEIAVHALGDLCESLVFVGGCATGLLVTTVRAHYIRPTEDVDVVTRVATVRGYHDVEVGLAARGFKHDISPEAPICRWIGGGTLTVGHHWRMKFMPHQPICVRISGNTSKSLRIRRISSMLLPDISQGIERVKHVFRN